MWLIGIVITVVVIFVSGFLTVWWRVESRQDKALCALRNENDKSHGILHEKVDDVRDKIEAIWIHMVKEGRRK